MGDDSPHNGCSLHSVTSCGSSTHSGTSVGSSASGRQRRSSKELPPAGVDVTLDQTPATSDALVEARGRAKIAPSKPSKDRAHTEEVAAETTALEFTGKFAGGLRADLRRRAPWYLSDWTEAFTGENRSQALASVIFLFFACLSPAVTFGMLFDQYTEGQLGVVEMILSSGISGVVYSTLSGQPLCVLGATGPELAYTAVFFTLCKELGLEFLPARVWQGLWTALFTIILSLFDLCALMKSITRFTEDIFSALISVIFIFEAFLNIGKLYFEDDTITGRARAFAGTIFALGTYATATGLKKMKGSKWLTPTLRKLLGNYSVIIAIVLFTFLNWLVKDVGCDTLEVPATVEPTYVDPMTNTTRPWIVNPMGVHKPFPGWGIAFTALPALGLTLLGYLDQNLTSLLINRKDHNLRKPPGYHLDLLVCGVFVYPICAFLGLPFTHAATVRSMTHLISLSTREVVPLDGGGSTTKVTKVIESRTTHLAIHMLLLLSLAIAPVMALIPRAVLFGVFLFMGVGSMEGVQFFDRLFLFGIWVPSAYPKYEYTKHVSTWAMHSFTLFQLAMFIILFTLTRIDSVSVAFPFFIGLLVPIRWGMSRMWKKEDLEWLDS